MNPTEEEELLPCPCCGGAAHIICDNHIFAGQNYGDRYPELVAVQRHGFMVECFERCVMTCWWHYDSEAIIAWNTRDQSKVVIDIERAEQLFESEIESIGGLKALQDYVKPGARKDIMGVQISCRQVLIDHLSTAIQSTRGE